MDLNATFQTWLNVLTHPNEQTFVEEQSRPQANFTTAIIWMVIAGVVSGIVGWISLTFLFGTGGMLALIEQMDLPPEAAEQMRQMLSTGMMGALSGTASISAILTTPLFFVIGAGLLYLIGRLLGGNGDLGRFAYLLATFQAPIGIISALLGLVPMLGACVALLLSLYSIVLTYFATKVGLNLSSGRAIAVIIIPIALFLVLTVCLIGSMAGLLLTLPNQ
ncbi:MAG: YIP1 family protein [Caldilineaceae bacterium]|nr:YIP1 family protein [Caldilineaceae bacterium]